MPRNPQDTAGDDFGPSEKVRAAALRMLARRPLSVQEVFEKLEARGFEEADALAATDWLIELGYLNDAKLAEDLTSWYLSRAYGPYRIARELRRRGLEDDVIDPVLSHLPPMDEAMDTWLQSQAYRGYDEAQRRRLTDALFRRGFDFSDIRAALDRLSDSQAADDESAETFEKP